jgi:putative PIN family toxin of toxin-antitoxin system
VTERKVVLDTSVLVSGLLGGSSVPVLESWRREEFILVVSPEIYREYESVLKRPKFGLPPNLVDELLSFVRQRSHWVEPEVELEIVRDPSDDKFVEAALSGGANTIVSSDRDLLDLKEAEGIPIVSPWEFAAD